MKDTQKYAGMAVTQFETNLSIFACKGSINEPVAATLLDIFVRAICSGEPYGFDKMLVQFSSVAGSKNVIFS